MGLFDEIICEYPLPLPEDLKGYSGSKIFQTKDLDCCMQSYKIDKDGYLHIEKFEREWEPGNEDSKSFIGKLGHFKTIKKWFEQLNTTTTIVFYDYQHSENTDYDYLIEYEIIFVDGKATSVKLIEFEATENAERKKRDAERKEKHRIWYAFSKTRKYKYFVSPYNKIISKIFKNLQTLLYYSVETVHKIERKLSFKNE